MKKQIFTAVLIVCAFICKAQIEVDHLTMKNFEATGFGGFLNFSIPVSDANYVTAIHHFHQNLIWVLQLWYLLLITFLAVTQDYKLQLVKQLDNISY